MKQIELSLGFLGGWVSGVCPGVSTLNFSHYSAES